MASRRMLDKSFILSDRFTTLNERAQLLYIRLLLSADDEGFVTNAGVMQRMMCTRTKPLQVLREAGLIHTFDTGITLILHWHVHNCVRKSTFRPTQCTAEKALVILDNSKIYRLKTDAELSQSCDHPASQDSIGKDRKEKDSTDKKAAEAAEASGGVCDKNFDIFWNAYPKKTDRAATEKQFMKTDVPLETLLTALEAQKKSHQWKASNGIYVPNPATWLKNRRWEDQLPQPIPYGGSNHPGEAELDMVRRILANPA